MHHTSNEREYFSLSIDVFNFENKYGYTKLYLKRCFFLLLFLIVHISTNFVLDDPIFCRHAPYPYVEGTVSQIFVLGFSFHFMSKKGKYSYIF